jgi:hypothetical protein
MTANPFAALPPDVREVYDLPISRRGVRAMPLESGAQPQELLKELSGGQRPPAHQAAKPRTKNQ